MTDRKDDNKSIKFSEKLMKPIKNFLENELVRLKRQKKTIKSADPFFDVNRTSENSVEDDLDEQIGHFDAEIKTSLVSRQMVELRKALTRIKIGKYGICENCGKMIDTDRLAVKPEATICIKCEKEREA